MMSQAVREHLDIEARLPLSKKTSVCSNRDRMNRSTSFSGNQDLVNHVIETLDDMFLRLFCMGTDKGEVERFKEKTISAIVDIKKNLDLLGLKYNDDI